MNHPTKWIAFLAATIVGTLVSVVGADDPVFSGPQIGENLPQFTAQGVFDKLADKEFDFIAESDGKPVLLIFFHERTRPAFGLTNAITKFAKTRADAGLKTCVIFLTDDRTETTKWVKNVTKHLSKDVLYGVSLDGKEGPGNYGLNRLVKVTILVGKEGKVTKNFAIQQPQLQADGPAILQAIVDVTGGGKAPDVTELANRGVRPKMIDPQNKAKLGTLLRQLIQKELPDADVRQAAEAVEEYVAENEPARKELARITSTIIDGGKLPRYGTPAAQAVLKKWHTKYAEKASEPPQ